jgi:hypothetical protein
MCEKVSSFAIVKMKLDEVKEKSPRLLRCYDREVAHFTSFQGQRK